MAVILFKRTSIIIQRSLLFICFIVVFQTSAQEMTGLDLLKKTIQYHDPNNNWSQFKGKLFIEMQMPNGNQRLSEISIDLPQEYFKLSSFKNENKVEHIVNKNKSSFSEHLEKKETLSQFLWAALLKMDHYHTPEALSILKKKSDDII